MTKPSPISPTEAQVVIEVFPVNAAAVKVIRRVHDTGVFLKMAAIELRRFAERAPEIALELRHMAETLEDEVNDLDRIDADYRVSVASQPSQMT
jgi:hypothetical protein